MSLNQKDLAILDKFNFNVKPVAVGFLIEKPDGVDKLDEKMTLCQMLKRAQTGSSFYAGPEDHTCPVGPYILGNRDIEKAFRSGHYGCELKVFKSRRANAKLYEYIPRIDKDVINYIAFSPLDKLSFEPDVLVLLADTSSQVEILLRAMSYTTGKVWSSKSTGVLGCAWILVYPYVTGELNYTVTGFGIGMKSRKLFKEGLFLVSIPFDLLPAILQNLKEMPWVHPLMAPDGEEFRKKVRIKVGLDRA